MIAIPPSSRFGERGSEKWKCGAGARQPSALTRPSPAAVTHPGLQLTPAALPEGRRAPTLPGESFMYVTSSSLLEKTLCKCSCRETPSPAPNGEADAPYTPVKTIHRETAAVHDIPGFIFLFSFALFSCLYIGHVNTRGLSWFRRLPWLFHSC